MSQEPKPSRPLTNRGRLVPFRKEFRTNTRGIQAGGIAMRRAYFSNGLSRRTREGRIAAQTEREFAEHCGYVSLADAPVTLRIKIQLLVGNLIYLATAEPSPDSKTGSRDIHTAQNTVSRILSELGLAPAKKPEITLQQYIRQIEASKPQEQPTP